MLRSCVLAAALAVASVGVAEACPDWQQPPSFGQIDLQEGFPQDPYTRSITAGGTYALANCFGPEYTGTVARKPDFDIYYNTSGASNLTIYVVSNYDTMLLINDPNGNWLYNDDFGDSLNPSITIQNAPAGLYDVWIGSFDGGRGLPGTLYISELY